jgi:curved DNA-binding protein CbpA
MSVLERSLYDLLGVSQSADAHEITIAFRRLAKEWHPDLNQHRLEQATERMKEISDAYRVLNDPERRATYDRSRRVQPFADSDPADAPGDTENPRREPWWVPPAGSLVAMIVHDAAPPLGFPARTRSRQRRPAPMACFNHPRPLGIALSAPAVRVGWCAACAACAILCLLTGAFLLFLAAARGAGEQRLARWALSTRSPLRSGGSTSSH